MLNFIRDILEARNHVVVTFSPWGIVDRSELGRSLADALEAIRGQRRKREVDRSSGWNFKYDKEIRKGLEAAKKLSGYIPYVGRYVEPLAAPALAWVQSLLGATRSN